MSSEQIKVKLFLFASCFVAVAADLMLVWWAKKETHPSSVLLLGFLLLNVASIVWAYSMRAGMESALAIIIYALSTAVGCSFLGIYIFQETLSPTNAVGMFLGLIALVLVSWPK